MSSSMTLYGSGEPFRMSLNLFVMFIHQQWDSELQCLYTAWYQMHRAKEGNWWNEAGESKSYTLIFSQGTCCCWKFCEESSYAAVWSGRNHAQPSAMTAIRNTIWDVNFSLIERRYIATSNVERTHEVGKKKHFPSTYFPPWGKKERDQ